MSDPRHEFGRTGEAQAEKYLRRRGCRIIARRFSTPVGELDLVVREGDTLVFVEVKTRRDRVWAEPEDAVGSAKQQRMTRAANWFLQDRRCAPCPCRFDVVSVILPAVGAPQIEHYRDAFPPVGREGNA